MRKLLLPLAGLAVLLSSCSDTPTVTSPGDHPAEVESVRLLELALNEGCEAAVDGYIESYHSDPEQRSRYRDTHLALCESDKVQTALDNRGPWSCAADLFEMERVRVLCRPADDGALIPMAYRTPGHFRGENTSIAWGSIRVTE